MRLPLILALMGAATSVLAAPDDAQLAGTVGLLASYDQRFSSREAFGLSAETDVLTLAAELSVNSDGRYGADIANFRDNQTFLGTYFLIDEGYTLFHLGSFQTTVGRFRQYDIFESPYSLFLNSAGHTMNAAQFRYEDEHFFFETRWIELNNRSDFGTSARTPPAWAATGRGTGFPDRGANLKTIVLKWGDVRFGIQDAAIYTGRSFDLEYFADPIPEYFTQYYRTTAGRPWTTSGNENNLIGFFANGTGPDFEWGAQVLFDDFSLHFILPKQVPDNPWKAAWTVGGKWNTAWGSFGLYHAGALRYTFEPITASSGKESVSAYGYTLYPSNQYFADGGFRTLSIGDNALGYQHGENNLALRTTWDYEPAPRLTVSSGLEFLVAGENSPTNPWHDALRSDEVGTHWLDDPVLARTLTLTGQALLLSGDWQFFAALNLSWGDHILKLVDSTASSGSSLDRLERIWRPSQQSRWGGSLTLGATWSWDISSTLWPPRPLGAP